MNKTNNPTGGGQDRREEPKAINVGFLDQDIAYQIHQTRRAVRQALRSSRDETIKLPPSGTITSLILIGLNPGITQNQIAACLFLDASKVALLLKLMGQEDWVIKKQSKDDRRKFELFLTEEGQRKFNQFSEIGTERNLILVGGLETREREQLVELLRKVQQLITPRR